MSEIIDLNDIKEPGIYKSKSNDDNKPIFSTDSTIHWISVDTQLPTVPRACWLRSKDGILPCIGLYQPKYKCWSIMIPHEIRYTTEYITHWAPI